MPQLPVDILVNNAGIEANSAYAEFAPERIEEMIRVDLLAPILLTRALLPRLLARRSGHVVNIASLTGESATAYDVTYAAAKGGLVLFTQSLRAELHGTGVSASLVCPGLVADAGMYADNVALTGRTAPKLAGVSRPEAVARAVLKAVLNDRAEIIVSPGPMRLVMAIDQLFPDFMGFASRKAGSTALFVAGAQAEQAEQMKRLKTGTATPERPVSGSVH